MFRQLYDRGGLFIDRHLSTVMICEMVPAQTDSSRTSADIAISVGSMIITRLVFESAKHPITENESSVGAVCSTGAGVRSTGAGVGPSGEGMMVIGAGVGTSGPGRVAIGPMVELSLIHI